MNRVCLPDVPDHCILLGRGKMYVCVYLKAGWPYSQYLALFYTYSLT